MSNLTYKITKKDLDRCWKFSLKYYLDETKSTTIRSVGSDRGVGGIIDSFFMKILEVAVCKTLEELSVQDIEIPPDFEIRKLKKGKTEPDVYKIIDKKTGKERDPNFYVEAKNLMRNHNWVGPKKHELDSITDNEFGIKDKKKMYYFWCEINDSKFDPAHSRKSSLVGSYLRNISPKNKHLKPFHSYRNMSVKILFVHTVLQIEQGIFFPKKSIFADPDFITNEDECKKFKKKHDNNDLTGYRKTTVTKTFPNPKVYHGKKNHSLLKTFGKIKFTGNVEMYLKKNQSSKKYFFKCNTPVKITSNVGTWKLKKGDFRCYHIKPSGQYAEMRDDNYFLPRRALKQKKLLQPSLKLLKKLADNI